LQQPSHKQGKVRRVTSAMYIWMMHFLKLRISVQTCSSVFLLLETCSMGTMQQCSGDSLPLQPGFIILRG
jgi:hypothetical protein